MDAISDRNIESVVIMTSSQVGKTEVILNTIGYYIHHDPAPILVVQPTIAMAETFSKDRLATMLRDSPALMGKVRDPKSRDSGNTIYHKVFNGGHITLAGSNSPASLASRPIRVLLVDELDRFDESVGDEGDPLSVVKRRTARFWNRKVVVVSTPTVKGASRIEQAYEESDKRRCFVPCPHCEEAQELKWEQVRWDKEKNEHGDTIRHHPETAHYVCAHCGVLWNDVTRWRAVRNCFWKATAPFHGTAGFGGLWEAYSSGSRLQDIVRTFLSDCKDPRRLQTFVNTVLGQSWEETGETVQGNSLLTRVEAYDDDSLPDEVIALTVGVDVQVDRLEAQVVAWGDNEESWVAWHEILRGDPSQPQVWRDLDNLLMSDFRTTEGRKLRILAACVDTGGHHGAQVHAFCKTRRLRRIYAVKGVSGVRPIWPARASKTKNDETIYLIGVDTAKDTIYGRLKIKDPGPGFIHFPGGMDAIDEEYFEQLTSEQAVTQYREGRPYRLWKLKPGKRNEVLDTFVYALAARMSLPRHLDRKMQLETRALSNDHNVRNRRIAEAEKEAELSTAETKGKVIKPKKAFSWAGGAMGRASDPYL
jgi:phage terminase large subunit GpA-like protein